MTEQPEVGGIAADKLRSIVERIERLDEERAAIASNIKDIYQEAKSSGFDVPVVRRVVAARKKDPSEVEEQDMLFTTYAHALGM